MIGKALCLFLILTNGVSSGAAAECEDLLKKFRHPCECRRLNNGTIHLDCDDVVFSDGALLPTAADFVSFSQRNAGYQSLPPNFFPNSGSPLKKIDLSRNSLRRLTEKIFFGLRNSLQDLNLSDNLFGDALNPIFSSNEFRALGKLRSLDLSGNFIRFIEEGMFEECDELQELKLNRNRLIGVPSSSLNGPRSLKILSLNFNRIATLEENAFSSQPKLEQIDLMGNSLANIAGKAFNNLNVLKHVNLAFNKITHLNSDVFEGAGKVHSLDLAGNFLTEFPTAALKQFKELRYLNLSSNLIEKLDSDRLTSIPFLEILDLSRNNIAVIEANTFVASQFLRYLDLSVNTLRAIDEDMFMGLTNLESLFLEDNNILLIPTSTLNQLAKLKVLQLGYNRISAVSAEMLAILAARLTDLGLGYNVIRELPSYAFQNFKKLRTLDLSGNVLLNVEPHTLAGLEKTLRSLKLQRNRIQSLTLDEPGDLEALHTLDVSSSQLREISSGCFAKTPSLQHLNVSRNALQQLPGKLLHPLGDLRILDACRNGLKSLPRELFAKTASLEWISISDNMLTDIPEGLFDGLPRLLDLNLDRNKLSNLRGGLLAPLKSLRKLSLAGNAFETFKGEYFMAWRANGTSLEWLDLKDNRISYLFPTTFKVHPMLRGVDLSGNKFAFFPGEWLAGLDHLQRIDLSGNALKTLDEFDFGRLPRLSSLNLSDNKIEIVSETAFHNSTQLQAIDLGRNSIEKLGERTFQGLYRIHRLSLRGNSLSELPDGIFDRSKVRMVERVDLSGNKFSAFPSKALNKQYFFLISADLSRNKIKDVPADDSAMVNIKELDLSDNPLSPESIRNILEEPKTVRLLNLANTGVRELRPMETPFLQRLNLSGNGIREIPDKAFDRTTLLEGLDLSWNNVTQLSSVSKVWPKLANLQELDLSGNPVEVVAQSDFDSLTSLKKLGIRDLNQCSKIEKAAFKNLGNLTHLDMRGYPKLGYLDVSGLLKNLPSLECANVECKDSSVGSEMLSPVMNPRLHSLGIWGSRVNAISAGALAGLKSPSIALTLSDTSVVSLSATLLSPLPRSSDISLDISRNRLPTLTPQFLSVLDDRRGNVHIRGLDANPMHCDCNARALRRSALASGIKCQTPPTLAGKFLVEISDEDLTCDVSRHTTTTTTTTTVSILKAKPRFTTTEPDIIWSLPSTHAKAPVTHKPPQPTIITNDDTLIIGIVGGVVAFIALLIVVICIIRLRMNSYHQPMIAPAMMQQHCNNPSCPCPKISTLYAYNSSYASTLPLKMPPTPSLPPMRSYATLNRPYAMPYDPYSLDDKDYGLR